MSRHAATVPTTPGACVSCDRERTVDQYGLCARCLHELRFIVRPEAHREQYRRHQASAAEQAALKALEDAGIVVVSSYPEDNAFWVCDSCNTRIPVTSDITLIPLLQSWALCYDCVSDIPYWPDAWCEPRPRACRCSACQLPIARALHLDTGLPNRGIGL
jgi:hypothetical protein